MSSVGGDFSGVFSQGSSQSVAGGSVQAEQQNMRPSDFFSRHVGVSTLKDRSSPREISNREGPLIDPNPEISKMIQAYLKGEIYLDSVLVDESNYQEVLNAAKYVDLMNSRMDPKARREMNLQNTTYELRTLCLQASKGKMQSFEAYTKSMNPEYFANPFSALSRNYAAYPDNYVSERVALQAMVLRQYTIEIHALARRYGKPEQPVIYALRGNTATGKTWSAKNDEKCRQGLDESGEMMGALATDRVKALLRKGINGVTNQQIHIEGAALNGRVTRELKQKAGRSTMIVDELLKFSSDIESLVKDAESTGKALIVKDLDGPLALSALRVLTRDTNTEPCAPMKPIESGLLEIRRNRKEVIDLALSSPTVTQYELHVMDQTGRAGLAAYKRMHGEHAVLEVMDQSLFDAAMGGEEASLAEIRDLEGKTVGELAGRFPGKVKTENLEQYWDLPIDQALMLHSNTLPVWSKK